MKYFTSIIAMTTLLFFTACENEDITSLTTETAVVEAYLYAGQSIDSLRISQSTSYSGNDSLLVTLNDLQVSISDANNNGSMLESIGNGYYRNPDLLVQSGQSYTLSFEYSGEIISATTYIPLKKEAEMSVEEITLEKIESGTFPDFGDLPDPVELQWENTEGDYYYVVVQNIEEDPEVVNELLEEFGRPFRFVSEPQIMDFYAIDPRREIQQFGMHEVIVFRVNPEYAALYETSGATSTTIAQPPTNVVNGLGLFTGVSSDTLLLNVIKG